MKFSFRQFGSLLSIAFAIGFFVTPVTLAATDCDKDADGFIAIPNSAMKLIAPDVPYAENGNAGAVQWQDYYNVYLKGQDKLTEGEKCLGLNFKKGAEPTRCDDIIIGANSGVYDPSKVTTSVRGPQVNPQAFDVADNGIDENCDGKDAALLEGSGASAGKDIGGLVQTSISLLSKLVAAVSILIMIWGGVLYATAAGDEAKVSKARKAIIGAVIGLIIGLLAPTIVNLIVANLT
ncbi:hypothetical protein HZA44_01655 [Candidatus Peregrinibacteria bacterium]|nr:hypothetical protein [Candidatus Peregrinibacteria bacterium]